MDCVRHAAEMELLWAVENVENDKEMGGERWKNKQLIKLAIAVLIFTVTCAMALE